MKQNKSSVKCLAFFLENMIIALVNSSAHPDINLRSEYAYQNATADILCAVPFIYEIHCQATKYIIFLWKTRHHLVKTT